MNEISGEHSTIGERLKLAWEAARLWFVFFLGVIGTILILSLLQPENASILVLEPNDVAYQDILAPYAIDYRSDVLTEQARQAAIEDIPDIYDPPDSGAARQQLEHLQATLDYIDAVRADGSRGHERGFGAAALRFSRIGQRLQDPPAPPSARDRPA